jgi:predicted TIM-barrel fold metal-dependent hydrolase
LADAFPETPIVVSHLGMAEGYGLDATGKQAAFAAWQANLRELARHPNVRCKIGGLGMPYWGFGFETRKDSIGYRELADVWRPYVEEGIAAFGPTRCMMESNFPPDGASCGYVPLWNAMKQITSGFSVGEKVAMFHDTAAHLYRIAA